MTTTPENVVAIRARDLFRDRGQAHQKHHRSEEVVVFRIAMMRDVKCFHTVRLNVGAYMRVFRAPRLHLERFCPATTHIFTFIM